MDGENDLRRQAADPSTPLTTLQQLAQHHPELRATIAENPSTYPALLEWLGRLRMPDVDAALARRATSAAAPAIPAPPPDAALAPSQAAARAQEPEPRIEDEPQIGDQPQIEEAAESGPPTQAMPAVPADAETEPVPDESERFDPDATAVYTDPDAVTRTPEEPPTFAPTRPVERPAAAEPTDSPTEAMPPVVPAWTPARGARPVGAARPRGFDPVTPGRGRAADTPGTGTAAAGPAAAGPASAPPAEQRGRRSWLPLVVLAAVALALVLVVVWQLSGGEDEERPTPAVTTGEARSTASPTATATSTPADEGEAARDALVALPESSTCDDPAADAGTFTAFAASAAPDGAWADPASGELVMTTLQQLQDSCGNVYAVSVASAITGDGAAPEALRTTVTEAGTGWVELARAAPPGAQERSSFVSPSQNITCDLGGSARCTIGDHDFAPPEGCAGTTTLAVAHDGQAVPDCGQPAAAGNGVLEYGQSATAGFFACTSEQSGMTCWSTLTGRGFAVARAGFQTF